MLHKSYGGSRTPWGYLWNPIFPVGQSLDKPASDTVFIWGEKTEGEIYHNPKSEWSHVGCVLECCLVYTSSSELKS